LEAGRLLIVASTYAYRRECISLGADIGAIKASTVAIRNAGKILSSSNGEEAGNQKEKSKDEDRFHEQKQIFRSSLNYLF